MLFEITWLRYVVGAGMLHRNRFLTTPIYAFISVCMYTCSYFFLDPNTEPKRGHAKTYFIEDRSNGKVPVPSIRPNQKTQKTPLMISQHWFRHLLVSVRQQTFAYTNVDLCRSMSPLGHKVLKMLQVIANRLWHINMFIKALWSTHYIHAFFIEVGNIDLVSTRGYLIMNKHRLIMIVLIIYQRPSYSCGYYL